MKSLPRGFVKKYRRNFKFCIFEPILKVECTKNFLFEDVYENYIFVSILLLKIIYPSLPQGLDKKAFCRARNFRNQEPILTSFDHYLSPQSISTF